MPGIEKACRSRQAVRGVTGLAIQAAVTDLATEQFSRLFIDYMQARATASISSGRSLRFLLFGELGAFVHFATLYIVLTVFQKPFAVAQGCGAVLARTSNFILNNFLTYRDGLKGFAILRGLLLFYLVRGVGLAANVGMAFWSTRRSRSGSPAC